MKKILFSLALLALAACMPEEDGLSGNDVIEFKDPKFKEALLQVMEYDLPLDENGSPTEERNHIVQDIDTNKDGEISVAEAKAVKILTLAKYDDGDTDNSNGFGITDMSEIKYFTSLGFLDCNYNELTSLDLSHNKALKLVYCAKNKLRSIDVSKCTELILLAVSYNFIEYLDVRQNKKLETLYCENNGLVDKIDLTNNICLMDLDCSSNCLWTLDLSANTALIRLSCYNNGLESIDLSNNTDLRVLDCNVNQLASLDISNNAALAYLDYSGNHLSSLDISKNTNLSYIKCINNNIESLDLRHLPLLEYLDCSVNKLSSIDVSSNTELYSLRCTSNKLTSLDLTNNNHLVVLYCHDNQLTSLDLRNCFVSDKSYYTPGLGCRANNLQKIVLNTKHRLEDEDISDVTYEYGDIIEYVD